MTRREWDGDKGEKKGEEIRQRTCMNDPPTRATVLELSVGVGGWDGWNRAKGEKLGQL